MKKTNIYKLYYIKIENQQRKRKPNSERTIRISITNKETTVIAYKWVVNSSVKSVRETQKYFTVHNIQRAGKHKDRPSDLLTITEMSVKVTRKSQFIFIRLLRSRQKDKTNFRKEIENKTLVDC